MASQGNSVRQCSLLTMVTVVGLCVALFVYKLPGQRDKPAPVPWKSSLHTGPFRVFPQCQGYPGDSDVTSAQVLSKELVIRRVLFDPHKRDGRYNAVVFIMEAKGLTLNSEHFSGCQVGPFFSDTFSFRTPRNYQWVQRNKHATSTLALIDCYNISKVEHGDVAFLYYKSSAGEVAKVQSLKPVFVPRPRAASGSSSVTAVTCVGPVYAAEHSAAEHGMLYHWLRYQKVIGVDHVHMFVEDNFVRAGGLQDEVVQQAIKEGYLSIDFWPKWLNFTEVFNTQKIAYQDCLYRYLDVYDYIIYVDSDDFFVPLKSKSIKDYLLKWCTGKYGSCHFKWLQFFPDCGWNANAIGDDGNFTAAVTHKHVWRRAEPKSAHQLKAVADAGTHYAWKLMPGYKKRGVPQKEAYFAHVRFEWTPKGGC